MLRTRNVLICFAAITLCLVGIVMAKTVHQDLMDADENQVGEAKLNYAKGANKTECQVNCWGLNTETEYTVLLCQCTDGEVTDCIKLGSFTTNKKGKGHLHARVEGNLSDRCVVVGIETEGDEGTVVTPYAYDTKRIALEPVLSIIPVPGPPHIPAAPKVVKVEFDGEFVHDSEGYYRVDDSTTNIYVTFDRAIDLSTVNENTFIVESVSTSFTGDYSLTNGGLTVVFDVDGWYPGATFVECILVGTPPRGGSQVMRGSLGPAIDGDGDGDAGGNFFFSFFIPVD